MNTENISTENTREEPNYLDKTSPTLSQAGFFYHEMMTHSVLFMHSQPKKIALLGDNPSLLAEILKHNNLEDVVVVAPAFYTNPDTRVKSFIDNDTTWLEQAETASMDVIIQSVPQQITSPLNPHYYRILRNEGLFICCFQADWASLSTLSLKALKTLTQAIGFQEALFLHFPEPGQTCGWRFAFIASKTKSIQRIREKDIYNRNFKTFYYNLDTHKAALALPEFMQSEL